MHGAGIKSHLPVSTSPIESIHELLDVLRFDVLVVVTVENQETWLDRRDCVRCYRKGDANANSGLDIETRVCHL